MIETTYLPVQLALRTRSVGLEHHVELLVNDRPFGAVAVDTTLSHVAEHWGLQALGETLAEIFLRAERHAEPTYLDPT